MNIQDVDVGEYDEADRNYNEKLVGMYRYMTHIKPYILAALTESNDGVKNGKILTVYANLCMTFGEFKSMTIAQMPNLAFKRKFFLETTSRFNAILAEYKNLVPADQLVLTEAEKKLTI